MFRLLSRWVVPALVFGLQSGLLHVQSAAVKDYPLGPDSQPDPAVPHGTVTHQQFVAGPRSVFPGTVRDYWVYVPAQYTGGRPAALMVFQDGGGYVSADGGWRVPVVFDNLIARGQMPVTLGVFVNPGVVPSTRGTNALPRYNRSLEYDGLGDAYARFLVDELLPQVQARYRITDDPNLRGIAGASSGAIAAFTVAWERPDQFRRVFSAVGTFVGLRGGNEYPTWVRKFEPRPLRVFLQDGENDQNIYGGNWWIANQDMFSALEWAGYAVRREWGTGGHDGKHGGAVLPDALRWLWQDWGTPVAAAHTNRSPVGQVLRPGVGWERVGGHYGSPWGLAANARGEVHFADAARSRIHRVPLEGPVEELPIAAAKIRGVRSVAVGPDGGLHAAVPGAGRVSRRVGASGGREGVGVLAGQDLALDAAGHAYLTDPAGSAVVGVWGGRRHWLAGVPAPSGLCLSPDQSLLYVADGGGRFVYSFQVQADGSLAHDQPFFHLHLGDDPRGSGARGMCVDRDGRLYVATPLGVQFCDQAGRVNGILGLPERGVPVTDACFGGREFDTLYVTSGGSVWRRRLAVRGLPSAGAPWVPPAPRL